MSEKPKCYVTAPVGTDLEVLTSVLEDQGYAVATPKGFTPGQRVVDALQQQLSIADLVVGVLESDDKQGTSNVTFELGLAVGLGKTVLVIASPRARDVPLVLSSMFVIRTDPSNRGAIEFGLTQMKGARRSVMETPQASRVPASLGARADSYLSRLHVATTDAEIIRLLREALLTTGLQVVSEARLAHGEADLAVWSDDLGSYVGNPIIIEVKRHLTSMEQVRVALAQISSYVNRAGIQWGILLYVQAPKEIDREAGKASRILTLSLEELLQGMREDSFASIVLMLRNKKVHGVAH